MSRERGNISFVYDPETDAVLQTGLVLSLIAVGIPLFTGWKGWEMVCHHRVGTPR